MGVGRLPRLIGLEAALDIILGGKSVRGKKALKLGLIDQLVPLSILEDQALQFAKQMAGSSKHTKVFRPKTFSSRFLNSFFRDSYCFLSN